MYTILYYRVSTTVSLVIIIVITSNQDMYY